MPMSQAEREVVSQMFARMDGKMHAQRFFLHAVVQTLAAQRVLDLPLLLSTLDALENRAPKTRAIGGLESANVGQKS